MNATAQYDLPTLLERAGAKPPRYGRGKWGCPKHSGSPSLSVDPANGLFNCHHAGCDFHGSTGTLARELGLARELSGAEYRELRQNRERADRAAWALYERAKARRFELLEELRGLGRLEAKASVAGVNHLATWDTLALAHGRRPALLAELAILENCGAADLILFLSAGSEFRAQMIEGVLMRGGPLWETSAKFEPARLYVR